MATRTVKARVELDGERQYKQALSELQRGNAVLGSEMRKLQAEYKGNTESTEFLTKKGELLERQLLQQRDKVQTLRDALKNAGKQYGESAEQTQQWQIKLNNAEAAQYDLEHAIEENNQALEGQGKTMAGLGDTVSDLAGKLGIHIPEGAKNALNGMKGLSTGTVAAMGAAAAGVAALVKSIKALHQMTLEAAADADQVLTESMTTGLSTQTVQQLQYAENLIDVSYGTITGSLTKLTQNMAKANDGNEELAKSFQKLGVSITGSNGELRSSEAVFYDLIDALGGMDNATERDAAAMELLGRSAQDLNPLIIQGSDAMRQLAKEAEDAGYVLDESQVKKLGEVDDAYQRMQLQIDATKKQLAVEFAPASKAAMELYTGLVQTAGNALAKSGIIQGMASLLESLSHLFGISKDAADSTLPAVTEKFSALRFVLNGVAILAATVADAINLIAGLAPWNWGSGMATTALGWNKNSGQLSNTQRVMMQQNGTLAQYESYYGQGQYGYDYDTNRYYDRETGWYYDGNPYNAAGTSNWRGGLTWVGENGPELVRLPPGSQVLTAQESRNAGGNTFNITISAADVREFNDIIRIAENARIMARMGGG